MRKISGKAVVAGDDITTEHIVPAKYNQPEMSSEASKHLFEGYEDLDRAALEAACIVVAGEQFGSGANAEFAAQAMKDAGVVAVVARSFARSFFRPGVNLGLALVESDIVGEISDGDEVAIELRRGVIAFRNQEVSFPSYPEYLIRVVEYGGLIPAVRKILGKN